MKTIIGLFYLLFTICLITSCNHIKLSDKDAEKVIVSTLNLPYNINTICRDNDDEFIAFQNEGLLNITGSHTCELTDKGKPYFINTKNDFFVGILYVFKAYDIEFDKIEGISINKEDKTAIVKFSLKVTNISPFAEIHYNLNKNYVLNIYNSISGEFVFRKFDSGWQIETKPEKEGQTLLDMILENNKPH